MVRCLSAYGNSCRAVLYWDARVSLDSQDASPGLRTSSPVQGPRTSVLPSWKMKSAGPFRTLKQVLGIPCDRYSISQCKGYHDLWPVRRCAGLEVSNEAQGFGRATALGGGLGPVCVENIRWTGGQGWDQMLASSVLTVRFGGCCASAQW